MGILNTILPPFKKGFTRGGRGGGGSPKLIRPVFPILYTTPLLPVINYQSLAKAHIALHVKTKKYIMLHITSKGLFVDLSSVGQKEDPYGPDELHALSRVT